MSRRSRVGPTEYRKLLCGPYPVKASGPRIVENFLDVGHFPFVHENILGTRERPEIEEYEAEIGPDGVVAPSVRVYQPDPYGTGIGTPFPTSTASPARSRRTWRRSRTDRASRSC